MSRLNVTAVVLLLLVIIIFWEPGRARPQISPLEKEATHQLTENLKREIDEVFKEELLPVDANKREEPQPTPPTQEEEPQPAGIIIIKGEEPQPPAPTEVPQPSKSEGSADNKGVRPSPSPTTASTNVSKVWDVLIPRHKTERNPPEWASPRGPVPAHSDWVVKNSTNGEYFYRQDGAFKDTILVVLGGNLYDETAELVERGYAVWRMREPCRDRSANKKSTRCHEQYGYLGYLSDPTAPRYDIVNFIHGHKYAWHQQYGFKGLEIASQCAKKTGRFEPHVKHEAHYRYRTFNEFSGRYGGGKDYRPIILAKRIRMEATTVMWNQFYGSFIRNISTTGRVMHWCCANFAVPRRMIELHQPADYGKVFDIMVDTHEPVMGLVMSGFWIERIWHLLFGEPQDVEPRAEPWVNCTDDSYEPPYFEPVK